MFGAGVVETYAKEHSVLFLQKEKLRHEGLGRSLERLRAESKSLLVPASPAFPLFEAAGGKRKRT